MDTTPVPASPTSTVTIKQDVKINATASEIYALWLDSIKHGDLTGEDSHQSRKIGDKFTVFGGWVTGENLELKQDEKIVQTWRADEEGWPKEQFSKITLELEDHNDGTCTIHFTQEDLPENIHEDFEKGWEENYWKPLRKMFED